ncbi:hypothetical protein GCM10027036_36910 [Flavihumibacter cheonanensis]|uniref:hypothetical protein n=1 Tax=Flavihumibacter cheonanensis TaxID=1442385 RepID=UPI001EF7AC50|nr:hypothetical protein [Flavihumibacter cheonanensis]MCG7753694.1 hypothetical protein [Flavihumibacter cheonanensis]
METSKKVETNWYPEKSLLVTQLSGILEKSDIENWEEEFVSTLEHMEANTQFKLFVNLHGFTAANLEAHKRFRSVIPLTLANYGWKEGYVNLFEEEAKQMTIRTNRGIQCIGVAHSHQDQTKMDLYESRFSTEQEHYFVDPAAARDWIEKLQYSEL